MKLAIVGSRTFTDYALLEITLDDFFGYNGREGGRYYRIAEVISGGAEGADSLAANWAKEHGVKLREILPDYATHPRKIAPLIRNEEIVEAADFVLAFWTGDMRSGTANTLRHAREKRKPTMIIYF